MKGDDGNLVDICSLGLDEWAWVSKVRNFAVFQFSSSCSQRFFTTDELLYVGLSFHTLADSVDCVRMESRLRRRLEGFSSRFDVFCWILLCVPSQPTRECIYLILLRRAFTHSSPSSYSRGGHAGTACRCAGTLGRVVRVVGHRRRRRGVLRGFVWVLAVLHLQVHNWIRMRWHRRCILCAQHGAVGGEMACPAGHRYAVLVGSGKAVLKAPRYFCFLSNIVNTTQFPLQRVCVFVC